MQKKVKACGDVLEDVLEAEWCFSWLNFYHTCGAASLTTKVKEEPSMLPMAKRAYLYARSVHVTAGACTRSQQTVFVEEPG